jgi:ATP-dependent Clp protease ATP-binding subunit ClpA
MVKSILSDLKTALRLSLRSFTYHAVNHVLTARQHAAERHHREVSPEHILLALVADPIANLTMGRLGLNLSAEAKAIALLLDAEPGNPLSDQPILGPALERLLTRSRELSRTLGKKYVGTEHLILGLLSEPGPAAGYLHANGITLESYAYLLKAWSARP